MADSATLSELQRLRDSIDNIDAALIHMLAERFKFTQQVGALKAAASLPQLSAQTGDGVIGSRSREKRVPASSSQRLSPLLR